MISTIRQADLRALAGEGIHPSDVDADEVSGDHHVVCSLNSYGSIDYISLSRLRSTDAVVIRGQKNVRITTQTGRPARIRSNCIPDDFVVGAAYDLIPKQ